MTLAAWVTNPTRYVRFRPNLKVATVTDSIGAPQASGGWQQEVQNNCALRYGDSQPTWLNHGVGGVTIEVATGNGQLSGAIADNPDIILIELGVNNIGATPTRSYIAGVAGTMLSTIRASLPNCMIGWLNIWMGHSEVWSPDPNAAVVAAINGGIADACATYNAQFIDVHSWSQADEAINNLPAPGTTPTNPGSGFVGGINTIDGTHPNWRGRPMMGRAALAQMYFDSPLYADTSVNPAWTPSTDVTPLFFLEADQVSPGAVNTWGSFTKFATGTAPTCIADGWSNGFPTGTGQAAPRPCVRFNGTTDVMTATGLVCPSGAKTIFAVYRLATLPGSFGTYYSLLTLTNGAVTTELMPAFTLSPNQTYLNCDMQSTGSDGFFYVGSTDLVDSAGMFYPIRFTGTFAGGSSTVAANYKYYWGGAPLTVAQSNGFYAQPKATALCALGARIADGVTPTSYAPVDLVALGAYASMTTVQRARVEQYLRRKWGP